ncbi:hypothetical protein BAUCODRAFT_29837 [Baudoinia panamericana UAMH 10762]|uniref:Uncharacterized protein n=1 Tax=Baudoinia panamericana (strain UAMH 10762) TaxID=717646 RepID=M2MRN4_BAUPA|nr:uncharacterized protein BAUCODRAFT_29837 [Baudoinia panamericana UAMH 10762]EMC99486.1 hypothetical protein BAUCODRAFT_29837 [Baudoinia panamericana UAMH 10762]
MKELPAATMLWPPRLHRETSTLRFRRAIFATAGTMQVHCRYPSQAQLVIDVWEVTAFVDMQSAAPARSTSGSN